MRSLPIDSSQIRLLATGGVQPVAVWAELADGSRRPVPDAQEKDEHGVPLWTVEVLAPPVEDGDRAEIVTVRIASFDPPKVTELEPVSFDGLVVRVSVNRRTGTLSQWWSAERLALGKAAGSRSGPVAAVGS
jgi:hypothetical protein